MSGVLYNTFDVHFGMCAHKSGIITNPLDSTQNWGRYRASISLPHGQHISRDRRLLQGWQKVGAVRSGCHGIKLILSVVTENTIIICAGGMRMRIFGRSERIQTEVPRVNSLLAFVMPHGSLGKKLVM